MLDLSVDGFSISYCILHVFAYIVITIGLYLIIASKARKKEKNVASVRGIKNLKSAAVGGEGGGLIRSGPYENCMSPYLFVCFGYTRTSKNDNG